MLHITDLILDTLRQNNKNKLSSIDFKIIKKYLDNLFKADIVFALHPIEYPYLCELMNTLVCWIAEKQKNLPVKIDEKILYSKMDNFPLRLD